MNASEMQQDSSGHSGEYTESRFTKESVVIDKPAEIVDSGEEGSGDVSSEERLLSPSPLGGSLERNCIKEQNDTPAVLGVETRAGQDEKLHGRESFSEAQSADEGILQEEGLGAFEVAKTVFDFHRGRSKEKGHVLDTGFPGQLLESWKKHPCPSLPLVSEAKDDQDDTFSVHSLSQQTRWKVERTCTNDCISGQDGKDLAMTAKSVRQGKVCIAYQADFSCNPGGAKTDEAKCKEDTALVFESVPKLCTNKNIKTNVAIKPCSVLLRDIGCEIKEKHECYLIHSNVKKVSQKMQSKKPVVIKQPNVILYDIVKRGNTGNLKKPLQVRNADSLLDDAQENQKESSLEPNSSASIRCSGEADSEERNTDYDGKKIESKGSSPDTSTFCDVGIFAKLSKYVNSFVDPGQVQENVEGKGSFQVGSVLIPEALKTSFTETKALKVSLRRVHASFALHDEAACESRFTSLRSGDNLKLDIKATVPSKARMPIEPCSVNSSTEEGIQRQVDVTEVEGLNQSNPEFKKLKDDDCWFLMEIDEVLEVTDPTDEDSLPTERDCGDVPFSVGLPRSGVESGCETRPGDALNIKDVIKNGTMEEESLQPHQSHGVRVVFYELCGLTVKLLGIPSDNDERPNLGRLIDLEDASSDEASQGNHAGWSANRRTEEKTYPVSIVRPKPSDLGGNRAKKKSYQEEPPANHPWLSQSQSRTKVVDALRKTLQKRLDDSPDLDVQENTVLKVAERVERALFKLFCCVDQHYKKKYRSLLFNLKSPDNELLFRKVVLGDITPKRLVQMTSLEMAPKELAEWRASENKRVLEVIEREEQEAPRCCPTKFTHKGIVEIHREVDEDLALQETLESQPPDSSCEAPVASGRNPSVKHLHHTGDSACSTSTEQMAIDSERGFVPRHLEQRGKTSKRAHPDSLCSDGEEKPLPEDSAPKKPPRTQKQPRSTAVWRGLIQMFSLKQFAAKAYPVSGSICHLSQALPLLLQSKGCILPEDVWVYLDSMWPANSKAMGIIRFSPSMTKDHNPYNLLYSYLNNKQRYGIVGTSQVEMFMVPLAAFQPLPSKLHPLGGPGLDLCHPSLLLGLILPKRTPTSILVTRPSPLPEAKKKKVTFKDSTETKSSDLPLRLPVDTSLTRPPRQLPVPGLLCESEGPQEPLAGSDLCTLTEELAGVMSSCVHCEDPAGVTSLSSFVNLQPVSGSPWIDGQTLGTLGAQPYQTMSLGQFGMDSDPSHLWSSVGFPSPSEFLYQNQHGVNEANVLEALFLPNQLCAEAANPHEVSPASWLYQIPYTTSVAEAPSSLMEETLALIQRVTQLQPHLQSQPPVSAAVSLPAAPQEGGSTLSQVVAGLELPPDQQDNGMFAQLQLLFSTLGGQAQPPSAI